MVITACLGMHARCCTHQPNAVVGMSVVSVGFWKFMHTVKHLCQSKYSSKITTSLFHPFFPEGAYVLHFSVLKDALPQSEIIVSKSVPRILLLILSPEIHCLKFCAQNCLKICALPLPQILCCFRLQNFQVPKSPQISAHSSAGLATIAIASVGFSALDPREREEWIGVSFHAFNNGIYSTMEDIQNTSTEAIPALFFFFNTMSSIVFRHCIVHMDTISIVGSSF
jgi:hypothetical protein